jgi:DNA (cytosine-5)-methyltransferase 1
MSHDLRIGSLFSGIGGLELGLERAGLGRTVYQVERDAYCRHVLARHWPEALRFDDVRTVGAHNLPRVDVLCGGFPCQDLSAAGKMAGLAGERSGLWFEMRRIVDECRPTWLVVENVAHTWRRYVSVVRRALWELGYASLPIRVRACDVGARHERARIFLVAGDPADVDRVAVRLLAERAAAGRDDVRGPGEAEPGEDAADAAGDGRGAGRAWGLGLAAGRAEHPDGAPAHDARLGLALGQRESGGVVEERAPAGGEPHGGDGLVAPGFGLPPRPWFLRGVHGLPGGLDGPWRRAGWTGARLREARIRALGNSVVPAAAEAVGRLIVDAMRAREAA